jgi:lysophospholipase L1-like esterase
MAGYETRPLHVVVLGDSLAAGTGDESGRGIAGWLEQDAAASLRQPVRATNLGVRGATTAELRARLAQPRHLDALRTAQVVVLSIGANDLFRTPGVQQALMRNPLQLADSIRERVAGIVEVVRAANREARILVLGGYNPAPGHGLAFLVEPLVRLWDDRLSQRLAADEAVAVVRIADLVDRRDRLSRLDGFHPSGDAYRETARRISAMLASEPGSGRAA